MSEQMATSIMRRRYRRSSDWMVATWCLFEHVRNRYCLQHVALIDNFGHTLVCTGNAKMADDAALPLTAEYTVDIPLPGRENPGVLHFQAPHDVAHPALEDLEAGLMRIFAEIGA